MASSPVPTWLLRDLESALRERRDVTIGVRCRNGEVLGVEVGPEFKAKPLFEGQRTPCPCGKVAHVFDNGRRAVCSDGCGRVFTDREGTRDAR